MNKTQTANPDENRNPETAHGKHLEYITPERLADPAPIWINPIGGKGDVIMLSTVLKRVFDKTGRRFRLMRRSGYTDILKNHPAIEEVGHPTPDEDIISNDYWSRPEFGDPNTKALAILCKIFGTEWDGSDALFLPEFDPDPAVELIEKNVPWTDRTVIISISSESPRKMMHPMKWHRLVARLLEEGCFVVQIGDPRDVVIKGVYSLVGCTMPLQVPAILKHAAVVISPDNYIMHAARACGVPAVALFGPTEASRYGYPSQRALQAPVNDCPEHDRCLGPHVSENYSQPCPFAPEGHCMNKHDEILIADLIMSLINK